MSLIILSFHFYVSLLEPRRLEETVIHGMCLHGRWTAPCSVLKVHAHDSTHLHRLHHAQSSSSQPDGLHVYVTYVRGAPCIRDDGHHVWTKPDCLRTG